MLDTPFHSPRGDGDLVKIRLEDVVVRKELGIEQPFGSYLIDVRLGCFGPRLVFLFAAFH